jgi:hypothetical protein
MSAGREDALEKARRHYAGSYAKSREEFKKVEAATTFIPLSSKSGPESPKAASPDVSAETKKLKDPSGKLEGMLLIDALCEKQLLLSPPRSKDAEQGGTNSSDWLDDRLTPAGPLALIQGLQLAASGGNPCVLRNLLQKAELQGTDFCKSLENIPPRKAPLWKDGNRKQITTTVGKSGSGVTARFEASPCFFAARSSVETGSTCSPMRAITLNFNSAAQVHIKTNKGPGLWSWATRRLQELDHCSAELSAVLGEARVAMRCAKSLGGPGLAPQEPSSDVESDADEELTSQDGEETLGDVQPSLKALETSISTKLAEKWSAQDTSRLTAMSFVNAQRRIMDVTCALRRFLREEVDNKIGLEGEAREAANDVLLELQEAEFDVFQRYAQWLVNIKMELHAATEMEIYEHDKPDLSDQAARKRGQLITRILEHTIQAARKQVASRALIGEAAITAGEQIGVGLLEKESVNPWRQLAPHPPWEVTYRNAVERLSELRLVLSRRVGLHRSRTAKLNRERQSMAEGKHPHAKPDTRKSSKQIVEDSGRKQMECVCIERAMVKRLQHKLLARLQVEEMEAPPRRTASTRQMLGDQRSLLSSAIGKVAFANKFLKVSSIAQ